MTSEILLRYLHFISIFGIVGALVSEHLLLEKAMTRKALRRMAIIDGIYGLSAILAVAAGLTLWFGVGKPADFYTQNWIFHLKLTLAVLLGLLSLPPTIFFLRQRKGDQTEMVELPQYIIMLVRVELILVLLIPLCAVLMAKGIGFYGG